MLFSTKIYFKQESIWFLSFLFLKVISKESLLLRIPYSYDRKQRKKYR